MDIKDIVPKVDISFDDILMKVMKTPGVKINRTRFLKKELQKYYTEDVIEKAINQNPAKAGIPKETINKISLQVINYETTKVTGISVAASIPGGPAMVAAAVGDITSYFVFVLRTLQELAYLYGFGQFELDENDVDSETMNIVLVFMGVMFGVQGAGNVLKKVADVVAKNVSKKLAQKALTKGTIYPIIKKIAQAVGFRMTKQIFADAVSSAVPIIGGVVSGSLTLAMFRPGCMKLRKHLMSYDLCDPDFYINEADSDNNDNIIDVEVIDVDEDDEEKDEDDEEKDEDDEEKDEDDEEKDDTDKGEDQDNAGANDPNENDDQDESDAKDADADVDRDDPEEK